MPRALLISFGCIATMAFGAVDYINQARQAGSKPGAFSVSEYTATIPGRFTDMKAEQYAEVERRELRRQPIRNLLPEPPEGWSRRDWDATLEPLLDPRYDIAKDNFVPDEIKNEPMMAALLKMDKAARDRSDAEEIYVYQNADDLISVRLQRSSADQGGVSGMAMQIVAANINSMSSSEGFAMVGGVAYRVSHGMRAMANDDEDKPEHRVIRGNVGEEVKITVRARASDEAIMMVLSAIDYDQLNKSLNQPVEGIGNDAMVVSPEQSRLMAEARILAEDAALREKGQAAEAKLKALGQSLTPKAEDTQAGSGIDETIDITNTAMTEPDMAKILAYAAEAEAKQIKEAMNPEPVVETPAPSKGFLASLLAIVSPGTNTDKTASAAGGEVKINRHGAGMNCAITSGVKRCVVGE